jgi:hypothetical protein
MSSKLRNPFKMRASEKIDSDPSFLRLFSPIGLESLIEKNDEGKLWENVLFIHSSPGGGKTSLLRIFEPSSLNTLILNKSSSDYRDLFQSLKRINAISEDRVEILGTSLNCTRNYEILEELEVAPFLKKRLFFSLLNARMIMGALRSAVTLTQCSFPDGLSKIHFNYDNRDNYFKSLVVPCTGTDLYNWASKIEREIYKILDSFLPVQDPQIEGHDELFALSVMVPENILFDNHPICKKVLYMLDDAHKLSNEQRIFLKDYIEKKRGTFSIWISERLEALESKENLGSFIGRDYDEIHLERFWSDGPSKFEKTLKSISEKRAAISTEDVSSFQEYLKSDLDEGQFKIDLNQVFESALKRIEEKSFFYNNKFILWLEYVRDYSATDFEKALLAKKVEILVNRIVGKSQMSFEFPHTQQELNEKLELELDAVARLFLSNEAKIPYYFGFSSLSKLSSNNIEQFLSFAGELFEEMISNKLSGIDASVSDKTQEKIIREVVERKWRELPRIIPHSRLVLRFLEGLGEFCKAETYKPNAPYAPGVNGFAIKFDSNSKLIEEGPWIDNPIYEPIINVISTCVAFNLLEVKETSQGKKGQKWEVYYLNRWLCVKFNLPLSYGGWRHKSLGELSKWTQK